MARGNGTHLEIGMRELLITQRRMPAEEAVNAARINILHAGVAGLAALLAGQGAQTGIAAYAAVDRPALPVLRRDIAGRGAQMRHDGGCGHDGGVHHARGPVPLQPRTG